MEVLITKPNDPIHLAERIAYGVYDTMKYVEEAKKNGIRVERRSSKCVVCPPGERSKANFGQCETRPEIECNCCDGHRTNCPLV